MMRHINLWIIIITILFVTGCKDNNDSFSPYTDLEKDYSLHCIIDNRNNVNLLRVQRIYTKENPVVLSGKTTATMTDQKGREIQLKDTLISGLNMYNFVIPANSLERGMNYRITANNDELGLRWGYFKMFENPELNYKTFLAAADLLPRWQLTLLFKKNTDVAFLCRLFLSYELHENGIWKKSISEIPIEIKIDPVLERFVIVDGVKISWYLVDYDIKELTPSYPKFWLTENVTNEIPLSENNYSVLFDGWYIYSVMKSIGIGRDPNSVKITGMFAVLSQVDKNYYYNFMAESKSKTSIRLDEQLLISNIYKETGSGYGFISSVTSDTAHIEAWYYYIKRLGYINGQTK